MLAEKKRIKEKKRKFVVFIFFEFSLLFFTLSHSPLAAFKEIKKLGEEEMTKPSMTV